MIQTGRYGKVSYDPTGAGGVTLVQVISLNAWKLNQETDFEDVSCFGNRNKVYVPGLMDNSGEVGGFWDSDEVALFEAAQADTPGLLELMPNANDTGFAWKGPAYLSASIDCTLSAPKVSGKFTAGGDWTGPVAVP